MVSQYQNAIENSNIVSKTDIEGIITFVNDEFCESSGYLREELLGKNHNIVRHPDVPNETFKILWDTISTKRTHKSTVKNLTKKGKTVYLNTTITPLLDKQGNIKEYIAIRYDVTKEVELKKELEEKYDELEFLNTTLEQRVQEQTKQLKQLNSTLEQRIEVEVEKNKQNQKVLFGQSRMASLGQMLANIAHQWRQPLTELNLTLFNMKKSFTENNLEKANTYYCDSKSVINNMSLTIDDFTNFFNPNKPKVKFLIKNSVNESLQIIKKTIEKENISVRTVLHDYHVLGISNELSQVIINLIRNSIDAFNKKHLSNRLIILKVNKTVINKNTFAILSVLDNAGGISEEVSEKLFDPYFTTKHSSMGTGLGLFMSKMIIEQSLNGNIEVNRLEDGVCFNIIIPLEP